MSPIRIWLCAGIAAAVWLAAAAAPCAEATTETAMSASVRPVDLRCEYRHDPLGIDTPSPRLSWLLEPADAATRGERQSAYRLLIASSADNLRSAKGDLWDTGKVESDRSIQVPYEGASLKSSMRCWWKVRVWDARGRPSPWSAPAMWSMGLLEDGDWKGAWIGLKSAPRQEPSPLKASRWIWFPQGDPASSARLGTRYFRTTVVVPPESPPVKASVALTADNGFELFINGEKAGAGGNFKQLYVVDILARLRTGDNVIAVAAANGGEAPNPAGLLALIQLEFAGGKRRAIPSDATWKVSRKESAGWKTTGFDDSAWKPARVLGNYGMAPWGNAAMPRTRRLPARYLRREVALPAGVRRATAYVSGLGLFELHVNGGKVGDRVLDPALTQYPVRVPYVALDVTDRLHAGKNALGVILGNGRYFAPRLKVPTETLTYGLPKLLLELRIELDDGRVRTLSSDTAWKATDRGPILANSEYDGEEYDARLEMDGWSRPGFDDSAWRAAEKLPAPGGKLRAQMIEPIRVTETLHPVALASPRPGVHVYDMGQNMVGWCRLKVSGPRGAAVTLRHAETLRPDGTLYLDNIRSARVTDVYTLRGEGQEVYEPRFTYHGFRYVEMRGFPGEPKLSSIEGRVVHDALQRAGSFVCSNRLLERIHRNIYWGMRGNYRSIPTDCPQRDERQGWLGDRSEESRGETYLFDVAAFYAKWMRDIRGAQKENGSVPDVAPSYWPFYTDNVTWPSSFIIIPGTLQTHYAETRLLQENYGAMKKWIGRMRGFLKDGIMPRDRYGDWCVPPEEKHLIHSRDPARKTPGEVIATTYFYHDLRLMERYAKLLGKPADAAEFAALAAHLKEAFNDKFLDTDKGWYANGSQTSCVLPLAFGMVPEEQRARVFGRLVEKILVESRGHVGTGLIGGQWLNRVLSDNGRPDLAYRIAAQTTYPSWGYMLQQGATTIWELWNGDTANPAMNSGNHVMLVGDLLTWLYEYLAGIAPDPEQPGFRHIVIRPRPVGDLTYAGASRLSMYGTIFTRWDIEGDRFRLKVTIPAGTHATVYVPATGPSRVSEGGRPAAGAPGVELLRREEGRAVYAVGSGTYEFLSERFR